MTTKRVIYEQNGQVKIVVPAPQFLAAGGTMEDIIAKSIPDGTPHEIVDTAMIPSDRTFRDAWKKGVGKVDVDMPKARLIHMDRIRKVRNGELDKTDVDFIKASEDANPAEQNRLKPLRQNLRDIPQTFDLDSALTPDELKARWPSELPSND